MTSNDWYNIEFDHEGVHYNGRVTPEIKHGQNKASSWHVVLNEVFFGYVHKHHAHWLVSEQRPDSLVQAVGKIIDQQGNENA